MTTGIVFHFENFEKDVFSGREIDFDAWRYACKAFGIEQMVVIDLIPGGSKYIIADAEYKPTIYFSLKDFEDLHLTDNLIYFETSWSFSKELTPINLNDFKHPKTGNTWYIFGPANGFTPQINDGKTWVSIPQKTNTALHSLHLAPIALYDRYIKLSNT